AQYLEDVCACRRGRSTCRTRKRKILRRDHPEALMETVIDVVLHAGRNAVGVALYTLLPIMVVMMVLMRFLEAYGVLDWIISWLTPLARPFGLTGLAVLAMIQISFISFVAPMPTLALMEDRGASNRHLAAALAAVLAMAPANSVFPLAAFGLKPGIVLL